MQRWPNINRRYYRITPTSSEKTECAQIKDIFETTRYEIELGTQDVVPMLAQCRLMTDSCLSASCPPSQQDTTLVNIVSIP